MNFKAACRYSSGIHSPASIRSPASMRALKACDFSSYVISNATSPVPPGSMLPGSRSGRPFGAPLDEAEGLLPDQRAERADGRPVEQELAPRFVVGNPNPGFGGDDGGRIVDRDDPEVPGSLGASVAVERLEVVGRHPHDPARGTPERAGDPEHQLDRLVVGQPDELHMYQVAESAD